MSVSGFLMYQPPLDDRPRFLERKIIVTFIALLTANLAVWAWAGTAFAHKPALMGMAVLAYVFGLRHAFDADHIAAIDNVVRRLMQDGKKPFAVGLFFSLGHSTIVVIGSAAIALFAMAQRRTGMICSWTGHRHADFGDFPDRHRPCESPNFTKNLDCLFRHSAGEYFF